MLTGITTRTSTPQEDAEPWPGGSARPVLAYLTGTLGMTETDARELLKAARTAQAEAGPGTLVSYPVPGGGARLLIHYTPGSRAYRFKLTSPQEEAPPGGAVQPGPAGITVTIWHNVAFDDQGRHTAMLDGYQPGDPVVRVFAYQASPGRPAEQIAEEAFAIFNDHPADSAGGKLACAYYGSRLRSLSKGDVVVIGEVALAVASVGWTPVSGGLTEVRTSEHGTRPLPERSDPAEQRDAASPRTGQGATCAAAPQGRDLS